MKHTPGPWEVDEANPEMVFTGYDNSDGSRFYICDCDSSSFKNDLPDEEMLANARLIAAAPELLEGYKDFIAFDWENSNRSWATMAMWLSRFNKIIAKAEGRE